MINAGQFIREICALNQKISLVNFMHDITYSDNQISMIVTDPAMVTYYAKHQIPTLCTDSSGRTLNDGLYINKTLESNYRECSFLMPLLTKIGQKFSQNYGRNSLHLIKREPECQHFYSIFFDLSESDFLHWTINNGAFLADFIANYNQKAHDLILEAKSIENRITLPTTHDFINSGNEKNIKDSSFQLTLIHHDLHLPIHFPKQQGRCLLLMAQGKSAKEIAKELQISFRTVEYYFDKTRKQLGCNSNKKLITIYGNQLAGICP